MPEGPEIRRAADAVSTVLVDRKTTAVEFAFEHLRRFEARLRGRRVVAVESRGKAILTRFDNGWVIYSHNQLYGRWFVGGADASPATGRQLRLAIRNGQGSALLYSASEIDVLRAEALDAHPFLARLGPDLLTDRPGAERVLERLEAPEFRGRMLAGLLLDQGFVAGLGNYLRAEILTRARLHPSVKPAECSRRELHRLARAIVELTERSYRTGGIVNPPALVRALKARGLDRREQYRFNTYGRAGEACHFCGSEIECSSAGGRKMYFCPGCQPPRRAAAGA